MAAYLRGGRGKSGKSSQIQNFVYKKGYQKYIKYLQFKTGCAWTMQSLGIALAWRCQFLRLLINKNDIKYSGYKSRTFLNL